MATLSSSAEQQARELLAGGASVRRVAEELGISRRQVEKLRKQFEAKEEGNPFSEGLQPTMSRSKAIDELVRLSTRPEGVRHSEMWPVLRGLFGMRVNEKTGATELNMTDHQLRYLKEKTVEAAAAQGKSALLIPEWIPREEPVAANRELVEMAGWLHERAHEYVSDFMARFPGASSKHVFSELVCLAFPQASPEPTQTRCKRNAGTARRLQQRLGPACWMRAANEPYPNDPDEELEALCILGIG